MVDRYCIACFAAHTVTLQNGSLEFKVPVALSVTMAGLKYALREFNISFFWFKGVDQIAYNILWCFILLVLYEAETFREQPLKQDSKRSNSSAYKLI